jgi:hypothetical protein
MNPFGTSVILAAGLSAFAWHDYHTPFMKEFLRQLRNGAAKER